MAISYDDYKKKYSENIDYIRKYNNFMKQYNQNSEEAKEEYKTISNKRRLQTDELIKKYDNQGIITQKSGILPTAGSVVLDRVNNKDYNVQNQLNRISDGKSLAAESAKEEQENINKFNVFNQQEDISKQRKNIENTYYEEGKAYYNYLNKKLEEDDIGWYDKTIGRFVAPIISPFTSRPYLMKNENGDTYSMPTYEDLKQQKVLDSYGDGFWGTVGKIGSSALYEGGKLAMSAALNTLIPGSGTAQYFGNIYFNQWNNAVAEGYSKEEALMYATMSTATEAVTSKLLGGTTNAIFGTGTSELSQSIGQGLSNIIKNNPKLVNVIANGIAEGGEEFIQEYADVLTRNLTLGENNELLTKENFENAMYSALVGMLTGGATSVFSNANINNLQNNQENQSVSQMQQNDNQTPILPTYNQNRENTIINDAINNRYSQNNMLQNNINIPVRDSNGDLVNTNKYTYVKSDNARIDNFRKSASQYFNNSTESKNFLNTIEKIIADKDYGVVFDNSIVNENGQPVNAQISTENGHVTIKVNPNSDRAGEFLIVHEVTHGIETSDMKQLVIDFASKNPEFNRALESLKQTYGTNDVNSEVLADVSGQLLGNQEFINSLTMQNTQQSKNIIRQIYESVRRLLNTLTENGRYKNFVQDLETKWRDAYSTTTTEQAVNNLNNTQYSIGGLVGLNNMQDSNFRRSGLSNYQKALDMKNQGIDNETIRQRTKWFQDRNGDWKFEIDDSSLTINNNILQKNQTYKLGNIINHDLLFKLYPELANYDVRFANRKNNGSYNDAHKRINISNRYLENANYKELKGTLIHEIQHAIQHIEGFETGTSSILSKKAYYENLGEIEADNQKKRYVNDFAREDRMRIAPESSKESPIHSGYENYMSNRNFLDKTKDIVYPLIRKGITNDKVNQEIDLENSWSNNRLVDGRGLLEDNGSFSIDSDAKRYDDLLKTNNIEYFKKDDGDIRVSLIDTNNNLVNQFDLYSKSYAVKELGEQLGTQIYDNATDIVQKVNIGNDINSMGSDADYFMSHRPTQTGLTADDIARQGGEVSVSEDIYRHPEYYFQIDQQSTQESIDVLRNVHGKPNAEITIYRATPGNRINPGDWIALSKRYAELHNQSKFNGKANILEMKVKAKDVQFAGDDINEFGYFPNENSKNSISNQTWQEYLEENYPARGTRTNMQNIRIPTSQDIQRVENNNINLPKPNKVLNPLEISKLTPEDANITPKLPNINRNRVNDGESSFASNIRNKTNMLNEQQKNIILSEEDVRYYDKVTNEESLNEAFERLNEGGEAETRSWFYRHTRDENGKMKSNVSSVDVAEGYILLKQYADSGDYDSMVSVAKTMRDMGTEAGQAVQAFNIMARMTPEGMVKYAQSELSEAYDRMVKNKTKKWIDQHQKDFDLTPQETAAIMEIMQKVSTMPDGYDKRVELAKIQKIMTDKLPPERGAGIKSWMRISMLFNPKTQVRNVAGNAIIAPVNSFSDLFASMADKIVGSKTGYRTTGVTNIQNYVKGFKEGLYQSYNDFKQGINTRNIQGNRFEIGEGKSFNNNTTIGKALNRVDSLLSFMLDAGDRTFYEATFTNSINNQLVLNNTTEVTQDMIDIATQEALSRTWQDNNNYTRFVLNIRKGLNAIHIPGKEGYGLGDVLIPFAKTPANLTKAIVDYSPAGLVNTLLKGKRLKNAIETGQFTPQMQHDFVQSLGKTTVGTMLYVAGYALAKAGIITGESDDDKDVQNFMRNTLGINSYSIKIGNKTFAYDWAQPVAAPLSMMANLVQKQEESDNLLETVATVLDTGLNVIFEQSFLTSINDVLSEPGEIGSKIGEQLLDLPARAIPTFMKQIADMIDGTQRTSFEYGKPLESSINSVKAKIPFLSKTLSPSVNSMGREIQKYGGKNNIFNVFLNPANVSTENISKSAEEIYRLYQETGDATIMPRVAPYYINNDGEKITMNSSQRAEYQKISGSIIEENVENLLDNSDYEKLSDEDKSSIIKSIVDYSYNKAREEVLGLEMSSTYNKINKYTEQGGNVSDYYLHKEEINYALDNPEKYITITQITDYDNYLEYKDKIDEIRDNTDNKKEATINYINSLKLSIPQKAIFIKLYYNSFNDYNEQIVNYINQNVSSMDEKKLILKNLGFTIRDGRVYW